MFRAGQCDRNLSVAALLVSLALVVGCDSSDSRGGSGNANPSATVAPLVTPTLTPSPTSLATFTPTSSATATPTSVSTPTATATRALPDLVPVSLREVGCGRSGGCLYLVLEFCVDNAGSANAPSFVVRVDGRDLLMPTLAVGERGCEQIGYQFGLNEMSVDPANEVPEADETNNTLTYPQPNGTRCDTCSSSQRPAPTPPPPAA